MRPAVRIFSYEDYKEFLSDHIDSLPGGGRGERRKMADHLGCQMSFITHVLSGEKHFNLEQIFSLAKYLGLSIPETDYIVQLLSFNRAGTVALKEYYRQKLKELRKSSENLKTRLQGEGKLQFEDEVVYYSNWIYGAIHMAATVPKLARLDDLSEALKLDKEFVLEAAQKLEQMQLIRLSAKEIKPGKMHLYLERGSPLLRQMHSAWRNKMIDLLNTDTLEDLHFTNCFSIAERDLPKVREIFVQAIANSLGIIRPSKEEALAVICLDLQRLTTS